MVKTKKIEIYTISIFLLAISIIGIYKIEISGSLIDDMPRNTEFFEDILFYEKEFNGILPLEIYIDTKRKKAVTKLSTIKKMKVLEDIISEIPELSRPISVVSLVKYSKQAYYNGNPKYYQVPTTQENSFILSYAKNSTSGTDGIDLIKNFVDSTGQYTRITTFMKDIKIERMERIEEELDYEISKIMPKDRYEEQIEISSTEGLRGWTIDIEQTDILLEPGESFTVRVRVKPPVEIQFDDEFEFTLIVTPESAPVAAQPVDMTVTTTTDNSIFGFSAESWDIVMWSIFGVLCLMIVGTIFFNRRRSSSL